MEIMLIRHAESTGNLHGIMQGQFDYPLSETGQQQAQILSDYLAVCLGDRHPTAIYASPLQRALQTAHSSQEWLTQTIQILDILTEVDSGIFTGLTWTEAGERYPDIQRQFKQVRDWGVVPQGESREALWQRATDFLQWLESNHTADDFIMVFTHGGFIRALLSVFAGIHPSHNLFIGIDNTSLSLIGLSGSRRYIRYINNTKHIQGCPFEPEAIPL